MKEWISQVLSGKVSSIIEVAQLDNTTPAEIRNEIIEISKTNSGLAKKLETSLGVNFTRVRIH